MWKLYQRYPDAKEAAVFYALSLLAIAQPSDKSFLNQRKAGKILEVVFAAEPNHPGVAHYLIHAYDSPPLASHALHMPSHIFTRLGLWEESITPNRAQALFGAARAAEMQGGTAAAQCFYQAFVELQSAGDGGSSEIKMARVFLKKD